MGLDRADADVQVVSYLAVGPALGDGDQDLLLPAGEGFDGLGRWRAGVGLGEGREEPRGDARGDQGLAVGGGVDGLREQRGTSVFERDRKRVCAPGGAVAGPAVRVVSPRASVVT